MEASKATPSLAAFKNRIWAAFIGSTSNSLYTCSSDDGLNWTNHTPLNQLSGCAPSLIEFNGKLWLAFIGNTGNEVFISSYDGNKWSGNAPIKGQTSIAAPSLAVFDGKLWVSFTAQNGSGDMFVCSSGDGKTWSAATAIPGEATKASASLVAFKGKLWASFIGKTADDIYVCSSGDGKTWSSHIALNQKSYASPSLAVHGDTLWVAFTGDNNDVVLLCSSADGTTWSGNTAVKGQTTKAAPALAEFNGKLQVGFIAENGTNDLFVCSSPDGKNWSSAYYIQPDLAQNYTITLESFGVNNLRSGHAGVLGIGAGKSSDTNYVSFSVSVNGAATLTQTKFMGDCNGGQTYPTNLSFPNIRLMDTDVVVFSYYILNKGGSEGTAMTDIKNISSQLAAAYWQSLKSVSDYDFSTTPDSVQGAVIGADIGVALTPFLGILGPELGAVIGYLIGSELSGLFPNCDGPVAIATHAYSGAILRTICAQKSNLREDIINNIPQNNSDCGSKSNYGVKWSVNL